MSDRVHRALELTALVDVDCCRTPMRDTTCDALGCAGMRCDECGAGCDITVPGGRCEVAMLAETPDEADARYAADRARHGLEAATPPEQLDLLGGDD